MVAELPGNRLVALLNGMDIGLNREQATAKDEAVNKTQAGSIIQAVVMNRDQS